jgi:hypothetical protein
VRQQKESKESSSNHGPNFSTILKGRPLSKEEQDLANNLKDYKWRLNNLYYVKDKSGKKVRFRPNFAQMELLRDMWFFSIILKARQLGVTTFFCIVYLDQVLWNSNKSAGIIAHKDRDAKRIFKDKIKFAWDNLPEEIKGILGPPNTDSAGELAFPNGSSIFVSTSTRGGTLQYLHISEFGYICAHYPQKAEEIVTGSINSVEAGQVVTIESTAEGRAGYFYDFCDEAQKNALANRALSELQFKFFFFPWWRNPSYSLDVKANLKKEDKEYFEKLSIKHGVTLTDGQKSWYIAKKRVNGEKMFAEYPSIPEEAFHASVQGAYYATEMLKVHETGRILKIPYDTTLPVDTWWDLGMNDKNVCTFTQSHGNEIRFIDYYENSGEGLAHYIKMLQDKGYVYGYHTFPHDINVKELGTGKSRYQTLLDLRLRNIRMVERTKNVNDDIEAVRRIFPRFYFDEVNAHKLIEALEGYRKEWNDRTGEFMNSPLHDKYSHACDSVRLLARGWRQGSGLMGPGDSQGGDGLMTSDFF